MRSWIVSPLGHHAPTAEITLCSVSFNSRPWLELNWQLAHRRNPATRIDWLIAENSPPQAPLRLLPNESRFRVVPGAAFERRAYGSGSYHHGRGMNRTLPHIATRFALFCDPDFFIVRENWIHAVIQHMTEHGIGILGVPWHPRWTHKVRYFPCVHCMFVDLEVTPVETLDFTPDIDGMPGYARTTGSTGSRWRLKLPDPLKLRRRRRIGSSRDVSWRIHDRYASDPGVRIECLRPVFRTGGRARDRLERFLPDRWSLLPQQADYYHRSRLQGTRAARSRRTGLGGVCLAGPTFRLPRALPAKAEGPGVSGRPLGGGAGGVAGAGRSDSRVRLATI